MLPPEMTHNFFNVYEDFTRPLVAFMNSLKISLEANYQGSEMETLCQKELIYPNQRIIDFEKKIFVGDSFVWEQARQFHAQRQQEQVEVPYVSSQDLQRERNCSRSC